MATPNLYAITSCSPKALATQLAATTATAVYTAPGGKTAMITKAVLCSTVAAGGATTPVTVNVVPSGSSASATNRVINAYQLVASDTAVLPELDGFFISDGDSIVVTAGTAGVIDVVLSVLELS